MDSSTYGSAYGSLAQYFANSGGTNSPGKAGGPGYNNDMSTGPYQTGDTQQASASSGSGWISAAASMDSTDKSNFSTPFNQGFGGITNYNVIGSPGAGVTGAAPVNAPPTVSAAPVLGYGQPGGVNMMTVLLIVAAVIAAKFVFKG